MSRRARIVLVAAVAAGALVVAVVAVLLHDDAAPFREMVAHMRAAGELTTFEGLAGPLPPRETNGADDLDAAYAWLVGEAGAEMRWTVVGPWDLTSESPWWETSSPEQREALAAFLEPLEPFLAQVEAAAAKPVVRWPVTRDPNGLASWDNVSRVQSIGRVLTGFALGARDPAVRLRTARASAVLATKLDTPQLVEFMVAFAVYHGAVNQLRVNVERGVVDPVAARAALDDLLRHDWNEPLPHVMRGECVWLIEAYQAVLDGRLEVPQDRWYERVVDRLRGRTRIDVLEVTGAEMVQACDTLRAAAAVPPSPDLAYPRRLVAVLEGGSPQVAWGPTFVRRHQRGLAAQRLARVALALAAHHATTGDWPASLDELAPMFPEGVPPDPYSAAPFLYQRAEPGVRVESAGLPTVDAEDRRDSGLVWELR